LRHDQLFHEKLQQAPAVAVRKIGA
jgi:hypothetical protein